TERLASVLVRSYCQKNEYISSPFLAQVIALTQKKARSQPGQNSKQENCELINVEVVLDRLRNRLINSVDLFRFKLDLPRCGDSLFRQTISKTRNRNDTADGAICH